MAAAAPVVTFEVGVVVLVVPSAFWEMAAAVADCEAWAMPVPDLDPVLSVAGIALDGTAAAEGVALVAAPSAFWPMAAEVAVATF